MACCRLLGQGKYSKPDNTRRLEPFTIDKFLPISDTLIRDEQLTRRIADVTKVASKGSYEAIQQAIYAESAVNAASQYPYRSSTSNVQISMAMALNDRAKRIKNTIKLSEIAVPALGIATAAFGVALTGSFIVSCAAAAAFFLSHMLITDNAQMKIDSIQLQAKLAISTKPENG